MKVTITVEVPDAEYATDTWFEALDAFPQIGARVTGVYHAAAPEPPSSLLPDASSRAIDHCPTCGSVVDTIEGRGITASNWHHFALPCGHRVQVTMWPDRVQLHQARRG